MRLADFIVASTESILKEWETFARSTTPGEKMNALALRDHAPEILMATVRDMKSYQSHADQSAKSKGDDRREGPGPGEALDGVSEQHAVGRLGSGFDVMQVVSEYRALRASVLRLWAESNSQPDAHDIDDLTR